MKPADTAAEGADGKRGMVLVAEDDPALALVVRMLLENEGYAVAVLAHVTSDEIRAGVGRLEPDCILLDGAGSGNYEPSWLEAVWAHERSRPVPVVMFTAGDAAVQEARAGETARSRAIYAVAHKPLDFDTFLDTIEEAVGSVPPFDRSARAEVGRTAALVARLTEAGATDVHSSTRREWVNFYAEHVLTVLYWSQRDGVYYVLRQPQDTGAVREVGRFHDLDAAVAQAVERVHHSPAL